jgi:UDP-glucose 4-epimerase
MSRVLLVGGAGFIGSYIAKDLLKEGDEVLLYDAFINFIDPLESNYEALLNLRLRSIKDKVKIVRGDIRHKSTFLKVVQDFKPEIVVHLAAIPIAKISNIYPEDAFGINLAGTVNVLETLREVGSVERFIYTSSSMVYGNFEYSPADENHPKAPIEVYGATKLSGELLTQAYGKRFGFDYTIIRPSAVYGPTDANKRVTQIFIENALKGKTIKLDGGGTTKLDFTFVEDVAHGFVLAMKSEKGKNNTFNITRGEGRSLKELVNILQNLFPNIKTEITPPDKERPERGALDISKARKLLGYKPQYSLEEGMKVYVDFVKKSGIVR